MQSDIQMSNSKTDGAMEAKSTVHSEPLDSSAEHDQSSKDNTTAAPTQNHSSSAITAINDGNVISPVTEARLDEPFKNSSTITNEKNKDLEAQSQPQPTEPMAMVTLLENLGEAEAFIDCPYCERRTKTKTTQQSTSQTSIAALFLCICCGCIPAIFPFICHCCSDTMHACEECKRPIAVKTYEGKTEVIKPQTSPMQVMSKFPKKKPEKEGAT